VLHNEELRDLYMSLRVLRIIIFRQLSMMGWGRQGIHTKFWRGNFVENEHLDDWEVDGRIALILISTGVIFMAGYFVKHMDKFNFPLKSERQVLRMGVIGFSYFA